MITKKDDLKDMLVSKGVKPTFQRLSILGAVFEKRTHPTIKSLHDELVKSVPTLSKTTLYSTLELFAQKGIVTALTIDPTEVRYDGHTTPHHHFFCERCGRIIDLDLACANSRRGEFEGHRISEVHGYFKGICKECLTKDHRKQNLSRRN